MTQHITVQSLTELAEPLAQSLGLRLWGVEVAFGGRSLIRIFVERDPSAPLPALPEPDADTPDDEEAPVVSQAGVTVEQCAELSRLLGLTLEVEDGIEGAYVLEVSSPGLDRTFFTEEQLAGAVGETVEVSLCEPLAALPGRRKFRGPLLEARDAEGEDGARLFLLRLDDAARPDEEAPTVSFSFAQVKKAKQIHVVPEKTLPGKGPGKGKKVEKDKKPGKKSASAEQSGD